MSINNLSKQEILKFMRTVSIMSAAMSDQDKPISTILLFAIDDDFNIYFATHENTYKAQALLKNPQISLSVWEHKKLLIQASGQAKRLVDQKEVIEAVDLIANATENISQFWPPVLQIKNRAPYSVFKIKLDWLRAMDLKDQSITPKEALYTEIKF